MMLVSGATSFVSVSEPYSTTVYNNGTMYLGKVGPGQTFFVTISSSAVNKTGTTINIGWNELLVHNAPPGWVVQNSSTYTSNLSVYIKPGASTPNGIYSFKLSAVNLGNYSKLGDVNFTAQINVTPDVFKLDVQPRQVTAAPGEPAYIYVTINNTGVSDNPFTISSSGLPDWNTNETVFALHNTEKQFIYPIFQNTPGSYTANITVTSASSPLVTKEIPVNLVVKRSLLNDFSALGQGELVFPVVNAPAYAVMYVISLLLKH
jgi:hypothetical protein